MPGIMALFNARSGEVSVSAETARIINNLRSIKSAMWLASIYDKKTLEFGEFESGEFPKIYLKHMDRPIISKYIKTIIISQDSGTEVIFAGFELLDKLDTKGKSDKAIRDKLTRADSLCKNISGDTYDGGNMVLIRIF
jgi:hypothetical protein